MNSTVGVLGLSWTMIGLAVALSWFASFTARLFYTRYPDLTVAKLLNFLGGLSAAVVIVSVLTRGYTWPQVFIFALYLCLVMCVPTLMIHSNIKDREEKPFAYNNSDRKVDPSSP